MELLSRVDDARTYIRKIVKNNSINIPFALSTLRKEIKNPTNDKIVATRSDKIHQEEFNQNKVPNFNQRDNSWELNLINSNQRIMAEKEKGIVNQKNQNMKNNFQNRYLQNISQPNSAKNLINLYCNSNSNMIKSNGKLNEKIYMENMNNNENHKGCSTIRKNILQNDISKINNKNSANFKKSTVPNTPVKKNSNGKNMDQYLIPQNYINNMVNDSLNNLFQPSNAKSAFERYKQKVQGSTSHHISNTKGPFTLRLEENEERNNTVQMSKPTFLKTPNSGNSAQKRTNSSQSMSKKIVKEIDDSKGNSFNYIKQTPKQAREKSTRYNSTSKILSSNCSTRKNKETPAKLSLQNANKFERPYTEYPYSTAIGQPKLINTEMKQNNFKKNYIKEDEFENFAKIELGLKWPNLSGSKNFGLEKFISKH